MGSNVDDMKTGDAVVGTTPPFHASFATRIVTPRHQVAKIPPGVSFEIAASIPLVGLTVLQSLKYKFGLIEGQSVLIIGASGGVGTIATQIARYIVGDDGEVVGVCSAKNHKLVTQLGAHAVFDYSDGLDVLMERLESSRASQKPFDLVLDCVYSIEAKDLKTNYLAAIQQRKPCRRILKSALNAPLSSKANYIVIGGSFSTGQKLSSDDDTALIYFHLTMSCFGYRFLNPLRHSMS